MQVKRFEAQSKKIKSLVVFVHGYGADGADLLSISSVLSNHFPDTLFVAPDAPTKCQMSPFGFQWFPIPSMDGSSEMVAMQELEKTSVLFNHWLDGLISDEKVDHRNVILFGFSQGTMLSLFMGPQRQVSLGGIIGFSGKLINIDVFRGKIKSRPPILLVHGDEDQVVSPSCLPEAFKELSALNFKVEKHISVGSGHGVAQDGLQKALVFLKRHLRS